ncbi:hypothetical protein HOC80_04000 [archaeon]|jgi:hypothetical protein|nr:hypothetical protein [archaeon]MBT4417236.1 hypothetical protein [archaeon]
MGELNPVIIKRDENFYSQLVLVFSIPYIPGEIREIYEIYYERDGRFVAYVGPHLSAGKKESLSPVSHDKFLHDIDYYIISLHKSKKLLITLDVSEDAQKVLGDLYDALVAKVNEYNSSIQ